MQPTAKQRHWDMFNAMASRAVPSAILGGRRDRGLPKAHYLVQKGVTEDEWRRGWRELCGRVSWASRAEQREDTRNSLHTSAGLACERIWEAAALRYVNFGSLEVTSSIWGLDQLTLWELPGSAVWLPSTETTVRGRGKLSVGPKDSVSAPQSAVCASRTGKQQEKDTAQPLPHTVRIVCANKAQSNNCAAFPERRPGWPLQ